MYLTMRCEVWRIANAPGVEQPDTSQHKQITRKDLKERKSPQARQIISTNSLSMEGRLSAWLLANFDESLIKFVPKKVANPCKSFELRKVIQDSPFVTALQTKSSEEVVRQLGQLGLEFLLASAGH